MRAESLGVAVAGAGAWGISHVRVLAGLQGCKLVAIADPDPRARETAARFQPQRSYDQFERLLDDRDVDAIVIATPARTHAPLACAALAAGKHVLVEKPLALDVASAQQVVDVARTSGKQALVGHLMVYHPALVALRELLRDDELGKLRYLHSTRVNLGKLRSDESALWSFGPHDLSMFDFLLGEMPHAVAAHGQAYLQTGIEDVVFMTLLFDNAVLGHVHLSWLEPRKERRLTLVGSRQMAELDDMALDKLKVFDRGYDPPAPFTQYGEYLQIRHGEVRSHAVRMVEPLQLMLEHFIECCQGLATPRTDVESGLRIVRVLAAAQRSLQLRGELITP